LIFGRIEVWRRRGWVEGRRMGKRGFVYEEIDSVG